MTVGIPTGSRFAGYPSEPTPTCIRFHQGVMTIKNLGTSRYKGGADPFEADEWLQHLQKNFKATRCPK